MEEGVNRGSINPYYSQDIMLYQYIFQWSDGSWWRSLVYAEFAFPVSYKSYSKPLNQGRLLEWLQYAVSLRYSDKIELRTNFRRRSHK